MAKTWAERFPHPGDAPARPADEHPEEAEALHRWWQDCYTWNTYVMVIRRHEVARMLDVLDRMRESGDPGFDAADIIAMNVGASFLDGTISGPAAAISEPLPPARMRPL